MTEKQNTGDLKERLLSFTKSTAWYVLVGGCNEAADRIERLETDLGGTAMAFEQYRNVTADEMEALKSQLAEARKELEVQRSLLKPAGAWLAYIANVDQLSTNRENARVLLHTIEDSYARTALQPKDPSS